MNAEAFWSVIANYNSATVFLQFGLLLLLIAGCIAARREVTFGCHEWIVDQIFPVTNV